MQRLPRWPALLAALAAFAATLALGLWRNDFPALYHADEPDKVAQVLSGERNFHHPPLMLEAVDALRRASARPDDPAAVARIGRTLSAGALAAANAILTLLAGLYGGPLAAVLAAGLLVANPHGLLASHYFKEDPLLALGLALTLAASAARARSPRMGWSLALGLAAGFAASTKHIGFVALAHALALECLLPGVRRARRLGLVILAALGAWAALNVGFILRHLDEFRAALNFTGQVVVLGNSAVGTRVPHLIAVGIFLLYAPLAVLLGLPLGWRAWGRGFPSWRAQADRWLLASLPLALIAVFSFSATTAVRYLLPVTMVAAVAAAAGWADVARMLRAFLERRAPPLAGAAGVAVVLAVTFLVAPRAVSVERGFGRDDRSELRAWIRANVPASSAIMQDRLAYLQVLRPGEAALPLRRLAYAESAADWGPLEELRAQGFTHIVVCWYGSRRFLETHKRPAPGAADAYQKRRELYLRLARETRLLWTSETTEPLPLRPGLSLYDITPTTKTGP